MQLAWAAKQFCQMGPKEDVDVIAYEPVWIGGRVEGFCTSGGFSHFAQKSVALALIPIGLVQSDLPVEIEILGKMHKAQFLDQPLLEDHLGRASG